MAALERLASRFGRVGVVSGRPVAFLQEKLGTRLWLSGLYGLETFEDGVLVSLPDAEPWRAVVAESAARAARELGDGVVESKGLSLTLHFRRRPELARDVRIWADAEAARTGLLARAAKASVELHPPLPHDKGSVVERAAVGMRAVAFLGDDRGDVAAFGALDRLAAAGVRTVKVAVSTAETPQVLLDEADVVVDGPAGALAFLEALAQTAES